jgi:DNA-binding ferritin-like protein (Dps family)
LNFQSVFLKKISHSIFVPFENYKKLINKWKISSHTFKKKTKIVHELIELLENAVSAGAAYRKMLLKPAVKQV